MIRVEVGSVIGLGVKVRVRVRIRIRQNIEDAQSIAQHELSLFFMHCPHYHTHYYFS